MVISAGSLFPLTLLNPEERFLFEEEVTKELDSCFRRNDKRATPPLQILQNPCLPCRHRQENLQVCQNQEKNYLIDFFIEGIYKKGWTYIKIPNNG